MPATERGPWFEPPIESAKAWVELFAIAFGGGSYASVARLAPLLSPHYVGIQSGAPDAHGAEGFLDLFQRVYALIPDLTGHVITAHTDVDTTYIETRFSGYLGGRRVTWDACDRFLLADGQVRHRLTYYDPTPLIAAILRPRAWLRWWRSGMGPPPRNISPEILRGLVASTRE